jgi:phage shock protein C
MSEKRLVRSDDRMVAGVCAGIAEYLNIDPTIVRFIFALVTLVSLGWFGVLVYIVLMLVMPDRVQQEAKYRPFDEEEIVVKDA